MALKSQNPDVEYIGRTGDNFLLSFFWTATYCKSLSVEYCGCSKKTWLTFRFTFYLALGFLPLVHVAREIQGLSLSRGLRIIPVVFNVCAICLLSCYEGCLLAYSLRYNDLIGNKTEGWENAKSRNYCSSYFMLILCLFRL